MVNDTGMSRRPLWESGWFWSAVGSVIAVLGLLITCLAWWFPSQGEIDSSPSATPPTTGASRSSPPPGVTASPKPPPSPSDPAPAATWPGEPAGLIHTTGSLRTHNDQTTHFDLDTNENTYATSDRRDVSREEFGLAGGNGTAFAAWTDDGRPTLAGCRAKPEADLVPMIAKADFKTPKYFCVRTSTGRYGYIQTQGIVPYTRPEYTFTFVIWKGPRDVL